MPAVAQKKAVLLAIAALIVGAGVLFSFNDRLYSMLAGESTTLGVVRNLTDSSANPELPHLAMVRLQNGSEIEASLAPGCNVAPGDTVRVRVLAPLRGEKALFMVVGLAKSGKQI